MACIVSFRSLFAQRDQQSQRREIARRRRSVYNPYRGGSSSERTPWQSGNGSRGNLPAGIRKRFMVFQDNVLDTCATLEGVTLNDEQDTIVEMPDLRPRSNMGTAGGRTGEQGARSQDQRRHPGVNELGQDRLAEVGGTSPMPLHTSSQDRGSSQNRQRASIDSYLEGGEPSPLSSGDGRSHSASGRSSQGRQPSVDSLIIQGGLSPTSQQSRWHENI